MCSVPHTIYKAFRKVKRKKLISLPKRYSRAFKKQYKSIVPNLYITQNKSKENRENQMYTKVIITVFSYTELIYRKQPNCTH